MSGRWWPVAAVPVVLALVLLAVALTPLDRMEAEVTATSIDRFSCLVALPQREELVEVSCWPGGSSLTVWAVGASDAVVVERNAVVVALVVGLPLVLLGWRRGRGRPA